MNGKMLVSCKVVDQCRLSQEMVNNCFIVLMAHDLTCCTLSNAFGLQMTFVEILSATPSSMQMKINAIISSKKIRRVPPSDAPFHGTMFKHVAL